MSMKRPRKRTLQQEFIEWAAGCYANPLEFVFGIFEWKSLGLTDAEGKPIEGPDAWQISVLQKIGEHYRKGGTLQGALQIAIASGHGIGKSALIAWIILWFMATRPNCQIIVTANTTLQLERKTWRELAKWHKRMVEPAKSWFKWTATKFYHVEHPEDWYASATPWSAERAEAFAGTHDENVLVIFDEASTIDDGIWETAEGAMSTPGSMWVVFGNPTRNTGRFYDCFDRFKHRWLHGRINSMDCRMYVKKLGRQLIEDWGADSDIVRVRVFGQAPRYGIYQVIPQELAKEAAARSYHQADVHHEPLASGLDVARSGMDSSVLYPRRGFQPMKCFQYRLDDSEILSRRVLAIIDDEGVDHLMVDMNQAGAPVADYIKRRVPHVNVTGVWAQGKADEDKQFANKRAEMYWRCREYLKAGGALPDDPELIEELTAVEYTHDAKDRIILEKKEDIKTRIRRSPDKADSFVLTFAEDPRHRIMQRSGQKRQGHAWDPMDWYEKHEVFS